MTDTTLIITKGESSSSEERRKVRKNCSDYKKETKHKCEKFSDSQKKCQRPLKKEDLSSSSKDSSREEHCKHVGKDCSCNRKAKLELHCNNASKTRITLQTNTEWTLTKIPNISSINGTVDWALTVRHLPESDPILRFEGSFKVQNSGCEPAAIINMVSNLQARGRQCEEDEWSSIAVNIINSTHSSGATFTQVAPRASSEEKQLFNRTKSGISLDVTLNDNSVFAIIPQPVIAPGDSVELKYVSMFNAKDLDIKTGDELRLENILTFTNVQNCHNSNEIKSLDCRLPFKVPATTRNSQTVILADPVSNITTTGGATFTDYVSFGNHGVETFSVSGTYPQVRHVTITTSTTSEGMVTNFATLTALPGEGTFYLEVHSTIDAAQRDEFKDPDYCTYSQEQWGSDVAGSNVGTLLVFNFDKVYPSGLVKVGSVEGYTTSFNLEGVRNFLLASGTPRVLTANLTNPLSTSAGSLTGEVLALQLNVDFNLAGVTGTNRQNIPTLIYKGVAEDSLNEFNIAAILAMSNSVLGGKGVLPTGYTLQSLNDLLHNLNDSFNDSAVSSWALAHLFRPKLSR